VALHGLVRDQHGKKMSKSRGNVIDPLDWIDTYGADALRFSLARGANPGSDQSISADWVQGSRNFTNKLWNATRFALLNGAEVGELPGDLSTADRWILSRLHATLAEVDTYLDDFQFGKAAEALYHFAWDEFCDWYVELAKAPLTGGGAPAERTRLVLGHVLDRLLRVLHPTVPFVTEALWTALTGEETVVTAPWPTPEDRADTAAEAAIGAVQAVVTEVRRFRSDQGLKPGQRVAARLAGIDGGPLADHEAAIRLLTRLTDPADGFAATASLPVQGLVVELDLSGAIDVAAERKRLEKDLAAAQKEKAQAEGKLGNEAFTAKAPEAVVDKIRGRLSNADADIARLTSQLAALPAGDAQ
jgi:valyl-tRNA synthetase